MMDLEVVRSITDKYNIVCTINHKRSDMNIYLKWCNRKSECPYCHEPVLVDTVMVVHYWKNKRGWTQGKFYHPHCLADQFEYKIKMEVPKPNRSNRGRPSLGLSTVEKKERATMLRRGKREDNRSRGAQGRDRLVQAV